VSSFVSDGSYDVRFLVFQSFVLWEYVFGNCGGVFCCIFFHFVDILVWLVIFVVSGPLVA